MKTITRRAFLRAGGAITLLVVGGGLWRAVEQGVFAAGTGAAYEPWRDWQRAKAHDPVSLVMSAVLASNAHNAQPWRFHVTNDAIRVFADRARNIGAMDSLRREMHISLGCAIENMCVSAPAYGFAIRVKLMPDVSDPTYVARLDLMPTIVTPSPLFDSIPLRHTNRGAFDSSRPVSQSALQALKNLQTSHDVRLAWFCDPAKMAMISEQTVMATQAIVADRQMSEASAAWFRNNWSDIQSHRDGITLDAQGLSPAVTDIGKMLPPVSQSEADDVWLRSTRDTQTATSAAYGVISIADFPDKTQLLEAGNLWQRLHLAATAQELAMQPLNQIVERADREINEGLAPNFGRQLAKLVGEPSWRGVFLFRIGYASRTAEASPRRSAAQMMV